MTMLTLIVIFSKKGKENFMAVTNQIIPGISQTIKFENAFAYN